MISIPILTKNLIKNDHIVYIVFAVKILFLTFPTNVLVKKLMPKYNKKERNKEEKNGEIIGILERILMFLFMQLNQIIAIGLVLTCKSITRFKQLENKEFAERYLIGTLLSTLITVIVYII